MSTSLHAQQLRTAAQHLRSVAKLIGASPALAVYTLAGPDTWIGPTAQSCFDQLQSMRRQLQANQQSLADTASRFERRAAELEQLSGVLGTLS